MVVDGIFNVVGDIFYNKDGVFNLLWNLMLKFFNNKIFFFAIY